MDKQVNPYFSDYFQVNPETLAAYGAYNISLLSDLPLFVDPFLLFNSQKPEYQNLHQLIIKYLLFLREKSAGTVDAGLLEELFVFREVKENWLGFTVIGNDGSGLGPQFGRVLQQELHRALTSQAQGSVTRGSHLEKLCLIKPGVGKDNISDFTVNLIKQYLLEFTQRFALEHIAEGLRKEFVVPRVSFNYTTESWQPQRFTLPNFNGSFVLLTPRDILTKEDTWINHTELIEGFESILPAVQDEALRGRVNNYFRKILAENPPRRGRKGRRLEPTKKEREKAAVSTVQEFPELIDYYIRSKEDSGEQAVSVSRERVVESEEVYIELAKRMMGSLEAAGKFYGDAPNSYQATLARAKFLKHWIEDMEGWRVINGATGPHNEKSTQLLFSLVWYKSVFDYNREPNNGRGPVDGAASYGAIDKSLVEFKLASNNQLEHGLTKQISVYEAANQTKKKVFVILCYTAQELQVVQKVLTGLGYLDKEYIVVIDARSDNKLPASKA